MGDQNAHEGHRSRMLEIYLKNGIKGFSDVQALEFLLGYAIPRIDVNPLAHRLLDHFGTIYRVLDASYQELLHVEGMGPRASALVTCVGELWKRGEQSRLMTEQTFRTIQSIGGYLTGMIGHYREERAFLMCLDAKCRLLDFRELNRGSISCVNVPYRRVAEVALMTHAATVVFAHNHPNGRAIPSVEDISYTRGLVEAMRNIDVIVVDHIIVSDNTYLSMKTSGMLDFRN